MKCKWINSCPLRSFEREGKIDERWKKEYCEGDFDKCRRYQMTERGLLHVDNMMPNGSVKEDLE